MEMRFVLLMDSNCWAPRWDSLLVGRMVLILPVLSRAGVVGAQLVRWMVSAVMVTTRNFIVLLCNI